MMMGFKTYVGWAASMLVACVLSGCGHDTPPPPAAPVEAGAPQAPFDVQKIMDRVHFTFRADGSAWRASHDTYAVRADALGLSFTPYHHPRTAAHAERARGAATEAVEGAPVHLGAARVSRGGEVLSGLAGSGQVEDSGGLRIARGEVVEHLRNGADGVEQSWRFARRPAGTDALEVRVPVEGGRFLGETDGGLHFAESATSVGVRYGHGTWVDARGERTPVPARFEGDAIVLRVPASVVDASAYPAVLDPIVSPEFGMDTPVAGRADNNQDAPVVAHDGTNYFIVWEDFRHTGYVELYGARVNASGTLLDPVGLFLSTAHHHKYSPAVTYDGTNFLVVWESWTHSAVDIYGARVSSAGTVLDPSGILISNAWGLQRAPAVAHDGTNFLVVWQDGRNTGNDIYGARVSGAGTVLDPNGIAISTAANEQLAPSVAHNGTNFLVVWQDSRSGVFDIYGTRVNGAGTVLNANGILISVAVGAQEHPAVAYNGSDFMVVWEDQRHGNVNIYGSRVSATGVVRNPNGIAISTQASSQRTPRVARSGTDSLVVWHDTRASTIAGARLSSTGAVLNPSDLLIAPMFNFTSDLSLASDGTNFLVAWATYGAGARSIGIQATRVTSAGVPLDTPSLPISLSGNGQHQPVVAHDGTNFLVVWRDHRHAGSDIYGVRVSETGAVLDSNGIRLSPNSADQPSDPAVAHDGTNFLVVWAEYYGGMSLGIRGVRVSAAGSVLDTPSIAITSQNAHLGRPSVAYDGTNFLVVWEDYRNGMGDIYGARVSGAGTVLDTSGIAVTSDTAHQSYPRVAHNGTNFLVVWQDSRNADNDIYGARVSSAGTVLDTSGFAISAATANQEHPALTHNGMHFLVVWEDWRVGRSEIYGARVDSTGTVVDPSGIAIATLAMPTEDYKYVPTVTHDGDSFLVAWEDHRVSLNLGDIYGARVSDTGTLLDTQSFALAAGSFGEYAPALTSMGGQSSLLVYRGSDLSATTNSDRVKARIVQTP
ncbi:TolB family protein [Melittangium boletus]|uniref:TolB family protein n=1 Tax=Melittangium boletus TaxID=83453 RepID=UPI003DA35247